MKKHRLRASDKNNGKIQTPLHADKWLIIDNVAMIYLVQFSKLQMSNAMVCDVTAQLFLFLSLSTIRAHNQSQPHFYAQVNVWSGRPEGTPRELFRVPCRPKKA